MSLILTRRKKIFLLWEFCVGMVAYFVRLLFILTEVCFGALIGFYNAVKSNSLLATEDYYLVLKDVLMERVPCCPSIIRHKSLSIIQ
jgi:hypothetical protein